MTTIERAEISDASELLKIKINAFAWDLKTYGMGPPEYDSLSDLITSIQKAFYYKILYNNKIVGGISIYDKGNNHYEIGSFYIDPDYQNKGIGSDVINAVEATYPQVKKWVLYTPYLSFRNHHFYEKMGYVKVGEEKLEEGNDFILFNYEKNF